MKVRCIYNNNIQNLENGKIYDVALLTKNNVKLLDSYARSNYSIKRFNIIESNKETPLSTYIDNLNLNGKTFIYKSNKINYNISNKGYLISYRNKINGIRKNDIFKISFISKNYYGRLIVTMFNIVTKYRIDVEYSEISRNFYNIEECEILNRRQKIEKIIKRYENRCIS